MERLTLTSFGRQPVTAGQLAAEIYDRAGAEPVSKWDVLRDATTARKFLGLSDRDLAVLQALLSFHQTKDLDADGPIIVFPSNKTLSGRAHGMAESTLRRHIAALVKAGLILRHDSPNGKRYARKNNGGAISLAFGFDLSPLVHRADELAELAQTARNQAAELARMRERCVLMVRDTTKLLAFVNGGGESLQDGLRTAQKHLRRQPTEEGLAQLQALCETLLAQAHDLIETDDMIANDNQNERHQESQKPEYLDSEVAENEAPERTGMRIPLHMVTQALPQMKEFGAGPIHDWMGFIHQAISIKSMLGITDETWTKACQTMGTCEASVVVGYMLERFAEIRSPGGYLRILTRKAEQGDFCVQSIVMSLMDRPEKLSA